MNVKELIETLQQVEDKSLVIDTVLGYCPGCYDGVRAEITVHECAKSIELHINLNDDYYSP